MEAGAYSLSDRRRRTRASQLIYGANLPTTPWAVNKDGRGPAWANSLFEDNAEFGLGYRLSLDKHSEQAVELLTALEPLGSRHVLAL